MKLFRSKAGVALGLSYLGLYLLSGIYAIVFLLFGPATPEFNPPSVAALPWSFVLIPFYRSMGIGNLYDHLTGLPVLFAALMTLVLLPGAMLNAFILYACCKFLDGFRRTT